MKNVNHHVRLIYGSLTIKRDHILPICVSREKYVNYSELYLQPLNQLYIRNTSTVITRNPNLRYVVNTINMLCVILI